MIEASLRLCATGARFVEIGKKDIWPAERVKAFRPDVEYHAFTFSEVADAQPELAERLLREMAATPVEMPVTRFPAEEIPAAFRFLAQARHVGKVAIEMPRAGGLTVRPGATYWITGGRGALGMEVARWLVGRGATRVILSGRSKASSPGGGIEYRQCDVSSAEQVRALVEEEDVRGIIHAGRRDRRRDHFAAEPGAAAPCVCAEGRRRAKSDCGDGRQGARLPGGVLIDGGGARASGTGELRGGERGDGRGGGASGSAQHPVGAVGGGGVGGGERSEENRKRLAARGMGFMSPRECLAAMDALAGSGLRQVVVAPVNWERYVASLPPGGPRACSSG